VLKSFHIDEIYFDDLLAKALFIKPVMFSFWLERRDTLSSRQPKTKHDWFDFANKHSQFMG
jgi:hypothetical protein